MDEFTTSFNKISANRAHNFTGGPSVLSSNVIKNASKNVINYGDTGVSIMELGHRTQSFAKLERDAADTIKKLLSVPDSHEVIWLTGGATAQFSSVVYNLYKGPENPIGFIISGHWSESAMNEAINLGAKCEIIMKVDATIPPEQHPYPILEKMDLIKKCSFIYYCDNETVNGVEFAAAGAPFKNKISSWINDIPKDVSVVVDMTSNIASRPFDVSRYSIIFAGAQKNLGTSGVTIVIVEKDNILSRRKSNSLAFRCPISMNMTVALENYSTYNTPPIFPIYVSYIASQELLKDGGLATVVARKKKIIELLEACVSKTNGFYIYAVSKPYRSATNISLRICPNYDGVPNEQLENRAPVVAKQKYNIIGINAHKKFKGLRLSFYNFIGIENVQVLCDFLSYFHDLIKSEMNSH